MRQRRWRRDNRDGRHGRGPRPTPAPASALKRLIEVVTGGLAGCLVAYYGRPFWFGPGVQDVGFPELPGVPWLTTVPVSEECGRRKPSAEKSPQRRRSTSATVPEAQVREAAGKCGNDAQSGGEAATVWHVGKPAG